MQTLAGWYYRISYVSNIVVHQGWKTGGMILLINFSSSYYIIRHIFTSLAGSFPWDRVFIHLLKGVYLLLVFFSSQTFSCLKKISWNFFVYVTISIVSEFWKFRCFTHFKKLLYEGLLMFEVMLSVVKLELIPGCWQLYS